MLYTLRRSITVLVAAGARKPLIAL